MSLETETNVDEIDAVRDANGNSVPAASATGQGDYSGIYTDAHTVGGTTEEQPDPQAVPVGAEVVVYADSGNSGVGYVGGANGDGAVLPLPAGKAATFAVENTDALRVKGNQSGDTFILAVEVEA